MSTWNLRGTILIACNCDWGCPCNFNARPTHGDCEGGWVWLIDEGAVEDTSVAGCALALFADWPGAIHEGGGQAVCYINDDADDAQAAALGRMARGELGGPWGIFITTYELDGPRTARFETTMAEHASTVTVGDAAEIALQPIRNPVSGAEVHPEVVLPEGLVLKRGSLAASKVFRVHDGIAYDHSGRYAAFGPFDYSA